MVTESAGDTAADAVASVALEGCSRVPCVIYAAKSTADVRGSSPGQLRDCREVISADGERWLVAEYSDEAFSAFRRSRGPDLAKAMRHAEELAAEHGESELWAQHSDRLARGDGRSARHAVEVALWALKHDVRVRTLQDPDTFRDLLYAVVTGQRNNEDSRRKGRSSKAGRRRAAERGDYIGYLPDGYRIAVEVDGWGVVKKRMVLDPQRQPAIELLFRLALRGKRSGAIARVLNDAGWLTKPRRKGSAPRTWTVNRVIEILKNPRYAGLAMFDGEVVAHGCWPAYISERQHKRIRAQLARRRPSKYPRELESYLLAKVGKCGLCGSTLLALTSNPHRDGTLIRRYVCASRYHGRHAGRCEAMRMDAGLVEAMFVSSLGGLLLDGARAHREGELPPLAASSDVDSERQRLRDAILAGDDPGADSALEALFAHMQPEAALVRDAVSSHRRTRELQQLQEFRAWITQEATGRTDASRGKARELNELLRSWFASVTVTMDASTVRFVTRRRVAIDAATGAQASARVDRGAWTRFAPLERQPHHRYRTWEDAEILGALQAWTDAHGRTPRPIDWKDHGAHPPAPPAPHTGRPARRPAWDDNDVIHALIDYSAEHDRPPPWADWLHGEPEHPSTTTVRSHFGSWHAALRAAGFTSRRKRARSSGAPVKRRSGNLPLSRTGSNAVHGSG
jgi:DNA invertase Pin-like site-specific DNA recombinase